MVCDRSGHPGEVIEICAVDEIGQQSLRAVVSCPGRPGPQGESALVGALAGQGGRLTGGVEAGRGHADDPSLSLRYIEVGKDVEVVEVLDPLGAHLGAGLRRVPHDRLYECSLDRLGLDPRDERPVELDDVGREREHTLQPA